LSEWAVSRDPDVSPLTMKMKRTETPDGAEERQVYRRTTRLPTFLEEGESSPLLRNIRRISQRM
jgi:hypothetical protein